MGNMSATSKFWVFESYCKLSQIYGNLSLSILDTSVLTKFFDPQKTALRPPLRSVELVELV